MPCELSTTQDELCVSGIGKVQDSTKLLQIIAQLTCEAAEGGGGGGVTQFIQLTDVPNSYVGQGGMGVRVNAGATGLEFYTITSGVTKFASANVPLNNSSMTYTVAHGLGSKPPMVRAVLVCIANDGGTGDVIGDESDLCGWFNTNRLVPAFAVRADATNVVIALANDPLVTNESFYSINPTNGDAPINPASFNNFALKIYAWL